MRMAGRLVDGKCTAWAAVRCVINIMGEADLLDAVRRCWVSVFTDRAILYRCQYDFAHRDVQLSVVVQQMVMSESSGILFTADPLTGHRRDLHHELLHWHDHTACWCGAQRGQLHWKDQHVASHTRGDALSAGRSRRAGGTDSVPRLGHGARRMVALDLSPFSHTDLTLTY